MKVNISYFEAKFESLGSEIVQCRQPFCSKGNFIDKVFRLEF